MRLLLPLLLISVSFNIFANSKEIGNIEPVNDQTNAELTNTTTANSTPSNIVPKVIDITLTAENDGWDDSTNTSVFNTGNDTENLIDEPENDANDSEEQNDSYNKESEHSLTYEDLLTEREIEAELPGKEINYSINIHSSTHHLIDGRASSHIGKILFKSRLMPSNEVKLSLKLKQGEIDDIELVAYFDLANFTMELDGSNGVLNKDHKTLLKITSSHLQYEFEKQYKDYDFPEHSLMLVQMLGYWSISPEGFVHEKRTIISE